MKTRRILVNVLRLAVTAACLAIALWVIDFRKLLALAGGANWMRLALLAAALALPLVSLATRWWVLLRANGFEVPLRRAIVLTWVGLFFNQFLPGSIGGDVARMVLTARDEKRKAAAAATVFLDRIVGLAVMILIAAVAVVPMVRDPRVRVPVILVGALLAAMIAGYLVYFNRGLRGSRAGQWIKGRLPFQSTVLEVDSVLGTMRHGGRSLAVAAGLSVLSQLPSIVVAWGVGRALGVDVGFLPFLLFEPIIFILAAVPVSVSGWGVSEVAYQQLFGTVGVGLTEAAAISVLFKFCNIAIALPGGVLFALGLHRAQNGERRDDSTAETQSTQR